MLNPLTQALGRRVLVFSAVLIALSPPARSQETTTQKAERLGTTASSKTTSAVIDKAGLFSPDAIKKAIAALEETERTGHFSTMIETVDTLRGGATIAEEATRKAGVLGADGIYILIDKQSHKLETIVAPKLRSAITSKALTETLTARFKNRDFDGGLTEAVAAIEKAAHQVMLLSKVESFGGANASSLVIRNQSRLTQAGARRIIEAAEAKARAIGLKQNIAVVDEGGHLLSFSRMDGARPASVYSAITKATSAATFRRETGPISNGASIPDLNLNLSLENAVSASGGKLTTLLGGVPVMFDGEVIGGVGVGGGTGEQDVVVAKAGIQSFLDAVSGSKKSERTSEGGATEKAGG